MLKIILDNSIILFSTNQWIKKIKINECITMSKYKRYSFSHESISINGIKKIIFDKSNYSTLNYRIINFSHINLINLTL